MAHPDPAPTRPVEGSAGIADRIAGAAGLLVGADFDGTLAPIEEDPDAPTITPETRRALGDLAAHPDATVAVISGRGLSDLRARVGLEGIVYAGNHGLELHRDGHTAVHPIAARRRPALRRVREAFAERVGDVPGCEIEDKGLTVTVHYRRTPPDRVDDVRSAVAAVVREVGDGLRTSPGKQVVEVRPTLDWDKGTALRMLAADAPAGRKTVYLGDDTTDEDAFRAIRPDGIGVLVGSREETAAAYRLPTQAAVAPFLDWLAVEVLGRVDRAG